MHGRRVVRMAFLGWGVLALATGANAADSGLERPGLAEAGEIRPVTPRRVARPGPRAAPPPAAETAVVRPSPAIDRPALQQVGPGEQPAPVPFANAQPPLVDRQPRPSIALGVPTPPLFGQGETFTRQDSVNELNRGQQGTRLPSPGATLRLPVW